MNLKSNGLKTWIILIIGSCAAYLALTHTSNSKITNEEYLKDFLAKRHAKDAAALIIKNSQKNWPKPITGEPLEMMEIKLAVCIEAKIDSYLKSSHHKNILKDQTSENQRQLILEPMVKVCIEEEQNPNPNAPVLDNEGKQKTNAQWLQWLIDTNKKFSNLRKDNPILKCQDEKYALYLKEKNPTLLEPATTASTEKIMGRSIKECLGKH